MGEKGNRERDGTAKAEQAFLTGESTLHLILVREPTEEIKMFPTKICSYAASLALITGLVALVIGCGGSLTGSSNIETREMNFTDFTKLEIGSAFETDISQGDSYFVSITVNDNLFQHLDIHQSGKTLHIDLKQPRVYVRTTQKVAIVMPDLTRLKLAGASKGEVRGFSTEHQVEFNLSGASSLHIDELEAGDTEFDLSGASRVSGSIKIANGELNLSGASTIELGGSAIDVSIEASGASHARLADFPLRNIEVNLSGASDTTINASGRLDGVLSGASRLYYIGNPTVGRVDTSGGSTISQR